MPINTGQPTLALNWGIMLEGSFPQRDGGVGSLGIGHLRLFGFNFDPRGMADTGGALLPISQNTALFSILGTTYGGNGQTTFALPNLDGRVAISQGQGPGLSDYVLGEVTGTDNVTLLQNNLPIIRGGGGATQIDQIEPSVAIRYCINAEGIFPSQGGNASVGAGLIGQISAFAGNFAPNGTFACEGQLLPISEYSALFAVIGTTYGGDGVNTFALPDLRGRTPVHTGTGPGLPTVTLGQQLGAETSTLTTASLPVEMGGSASPISNYGPSLGINFAIALTGIFPSRNAEVIKDGDSQTGVGTEFGDPPYIGEIIMFAGNFAPSGYALANGQLLSIAQNTALFSLLGTTYGGDGRTTFALPDLRGRAAADDSIFEPTGTVTGSATTTLTLNDFPALFLSGTAGNDTYYGANLGDVLNGNNGDDTLIGNGGGDLIDGGAGADTMSGGSGNDTFTVDNAGDVVSGGADYDRVNVSIAFYDTGDDVEEITYTGSGSFTTRSGNNNNVINGGALGDIIKARGGNDTVNGGGGDDDINGGGGTDTLNGGEGNDILRVDNAGDIANGGSGTDTVAVMAAITYNASANSDVETFENASGGNVTVTMNSLDNLYGGGSASIGMDTVNGGGGNDQVYGYGGADTLNGDAGNDRLFGGTGNDVINGGSESDVLEGGADNDTLTGGTGDDTLYGEDGTDTLTGGAGFDTLVGGTSADRFVFTAASDTPTLNAADRLVDFSSAQGDRIDLTAIDAIAGGGDNAFSFIGTAAFSNIAGQLRTEVIFGNTYVMGDTNGDGTADFFIKLDGTVTLSAGDFNL